MRGPRAAGRLSDTPSGREPTGPGEAWQRTSPGPPAVRGVGGVGVSR
jgi:hypothetical protein